MQLIGNSSICVMLAINNMAITSIPTPIFSKFISIIFKIDKWNCLF